MHLRTLGQLCGGGVQLGDFSIAALAMSAIKISSPLLLQQKHSVYTQQHDYMPGNAAAMRRVYRAAHHHSNPPSHRTWLIATLALGLLWLLWERPALSAALHTYVRGGQHPEADDCPDVPSLPMASWGFARACCTIYPKEFGKYNPARGGRSLRGRGAAHLAVQLMQLLQAGDRLARPWSYPRSFFEAGVRSDPHYFYQHVFSARETVYVVTPDLAAFVDVFLALPASARITLVTGSEDIGAPFEIFHPTNRSDRAGRPYFDYTLDALWPRGQPVSMRTFIADPRLEHWFAQNYDLVGCGVYTCSDVDLSVPADVALLHKVQPLPIGLDLHSLSEKRPNANANPNPSGFSEKRGVGAASVQSRICQQRKDLQSALQRSGAGLGFAERRLVAHAEFECAFGPKGHELRERSRGELCRLLAEHRGDARFSFPPRALHPHLSRANASGPAPSPSPGPQVSPEQTADAREAFWMRVAACAFALAPPGFGMDTHRVWEVMQMRTVPIVLSSPLDALYRDFPVVLLASWAEAFEPGALERFRADIQRRFGREPFSPRVVHRLTADYWVRQVNSSRAQGLPPVQF